jgi:hypothetical protein
LLASASGTAGLDAHPNGALQRDGNGIGFASSTTATIAKVAGDAEGVKSHYPDVRVLIFSTPAKVSKHKEAVWARKILAQFGLQLVVVSREEFIRWLRAPSQSEICRELGIAPSMPQELEPALKRAQEAAKEIADN